MDTDELVEDSNSESETSIDTDELVEEDTEDTEDTEDAEEGISQLGGGKIILSLGINNSSSAKEYKKNSENTYKKSLSKEKVEYLDTEEKKVRELMVSKEPPKYRILNSFLNSNIKAMAMQKLEAINNLTPDSSEYYKMKNWLDGLLKIPFGRQVESKVKLEDGSEKIREHLFKLKKCLDTSIYGMENAKAEIIQHIAHSITNPSAIGNILALEGPPGTGKTSLIKNGVAKALDRPFSFISLGGATDSSFLEGHGYTYEGATWGKIVSIITKCECMNPIIFFDEIDKVSATKKGDEIIGILMHLIDQTQNTSFHDKYYSDIEFDLSKAFFIFSFNDINKIDPILRDRMNIIKIPGYIKKDKYTIATDYMIPELITEYGFKNDEVKFSKDSIDYLISLSEKDKGVRQLKRDISNVISRLNTLRFSGKDGDPNYIKLPYSIKKINYPFEVDIEIARKLNKKTSSENNGPPMGMYT